MSEETNVDVEEVTETLPEGHVRITATETQSGKTATFVFDFKTDALSAVEAFGDSVVHEHFIRAAKVAAQSNMRGLLKNKSVAEVEKLMEDWKPGSAIQDSVGNFMKTFSNMTQEERDAIIAALQQQS